jgi:uncharacterized membrane protein
MVGFHFCRDLEIVGLVPPGTTFGGWWDIWARSVAGSFLALAGLSLWLAHGRGIAWSGFLRRLATLAAAATLVSLATWIAMPGQWVRFGILHSIALCSVLALPFLKLPWWIGAGSAAAILWLAPMLRTPALDGALWLWSGLGTAPPPMMDWEPVVPWLAPMLAGVALGRLGATRGWWARLAGAAQGPDWLAWPGRHSLAIYLVHQPVLIGGMMAWVRVWG